jgi:hypothetical protein
MRIDLEADLTETAIRTVAVAHRAEADSAALVVYTQHRSGPLPRQAEVLRVVDLLEEQGIAVRDALLVHEGRWWSYACTDESCCPLPGNLLPNSTPVLAAQRVASGRRATAASREDAAAAFRLGRELPHEALQAAQEALDALDRPMRAEYVMNALTALCALHAAPDRDDVDDSLVESLRAVLAVGIGDVHVRDHLLGRACQVWTDLAAPCDALVQTALASPAHLRPQAAASAMALLAAEGSSAVALWEMASLAPEENLTRLVRAGVEAGFPPEALREVLTQALPEVEHALSTIRA